MKRKSRGRAIFFLLSTMKVYHSRPVLPRWHTRIQIHFDSIIPTTSNKSMFTAVEMMKELITAATGLW